MKSSFLAFCLALALSVCEGKKDAEFIGQSSTTTSVRGVSDINVKELYACPRCRRATPPGPRNRPANQNPGTMSA